MCDMCKFFDDANDDSSMERQVSVVDKAHSETALTIASCDLENEGFRIKAMEDM
jgi:hypothetical protein